jgi:hypothetical protein
VRRGRPTARVSGRKSFSVTVAAAARAARRRVRPASRWSPATASVFPFHIPPGAVGGQVGPFGAGGDAYAPTEGGPRRLVRRREAAHAAGELTPGAHRQV